MITVQITDTVSELLKEAASMFGGEERAAIEAEAGRSAVLAATQYHLQYDAAGKWRSPTGLRGGMSSGFGAEVANAWEFKDAQLINGAPLYAIKVYGGTIVPKVAGALTIPLVPEAKGRRARDYEIAMGRRLFTIPGRNALFEQYTLGASESVLRRTYGKRKGGQRVQLAARSGIRAIYALMQSVTMQPWPGALPPDEVLGEAYAEPWDKRIKQLFE